MFDKSTNQAPQGIASLGQDEEPIDIDVEEPNDDSIETDVGGKPALPPPTFRSNLAEYIDEEELSRIAEECCEDYETDLQSRAEWEKTYKEGLQLLGLNIEERTEPWSGACGVYHPLLTEAVIRFQAETITETFPAAGPVKTKIIGKTDKKKEEAAVRVREDMNYQLTEVMSEYRREHERLLWNVGSAGAGFKKVYFDPALGRQTSVFVGAEDVIVDYGSSDLFTAQRMTFRMRKSKNDVDKLMAAKFYREVNLGDPVADQSEVERKKDELTGQDGKDDDRYLLLECHVSLDIEGFEDPSGLPLPYVVHIEKQSQKVLAVYRNWKETDAHKLKRQHFVQYGYVPGFGFYDYGLIHLVGGFASSATSMIRQLVDAGTLSNLPGGLKSRGLRIKGDDTPISPGEWRDVDVPGGVIRDNILPLPYKEPSQTLFSLYQNVVEEGRKLANTSDADVSDMGKEAPVGTTLALLERTLKSSNAVQARIHASMKQELQLLKEIMAETAPVYTFDMDSGNRKACQSDYAMVEVIPVSDPNASTMSQRVVVYDAATKLSATAPQIYDLAFLHAQMLNALGLKDVDKIIPQSAEQQPTDPVMENMNILKCMPVKAFLAQDHAAHLAVHMAAIQDPMIMQAMGQNPKAQQIIGEAQAHIAEHLGFQYRAQMEQTMGQQLPPPGQPMPPEQEAQLSRGMAQAATQLLQQSQQKVAQAQALAAAQDPVVQAQQKDLAIKQAEVDRKAAKDQRDAELESRRLDILQNQIDAGQENIAFQTMHNGLVQKKAQDAQQENTAFQTMTNAAAQAQGAKMQQETARLNNEAALKKQHAQGMHTVANTVIGHLIAGQKNAGPREGSDE